jgi:hypothetical protein
LPQEQRSRPSSSRRKTTTSMGAMDTEVCPEREQEELSLA